MDRKNRKRGDEERGNKEENKRKRKRVEEIGQGEREEL